MTQTTTDILVIGAGMGGSSVAAECSRSASVTLIEREEQPGYHSTGRSAAAFIPSYGCENPVLRGLTNCSGEFLRTPPPGFSEHSLLHRRGLLTLQYCGTGQTAEAECGRLGSMGIDARLTDPARVRALLPIVKHEYVEAGWFEPDVYDIDVNALHQGYLRQFRAQGGQYVGGAGISTITFRDGYWEVQSTRGLFKAGCIVNAAGAWADEVARLAGMVPLKLQPMRRTAVLLEAPPGCDVKRWPLTVAHAESFYLKPDAGLIMVSPGDEHHSQPCDARPEEIDVACAVECARRALDFDVRRVSHSWAGLRCFVSDRTPVIGYASDHDRFFWLAGQGGHGIQIAPAAANLAASLLLGEKLPRHLQRAGISADLLSPARLAGVMATAAQEQLQQ